ncbi:DEKNAAC105682 [Brettanomyces naardenensis]|uniref:DEKNAAC105682 n=1 Tax=Brettanomyces naardenensis TaxID=13370 RepID=A0A448YTY6_BRENA|nr:DEKNAAC105682 [Brettanomyces naardenensis]
MQLLILFIVVVASASAVKSSVPAPLLGCVSQFARECNGELNDYSIICVKRESFLKCLAENCAFGNFLPARDHFLGTCLNLVPELRDDKRYEFYRNPIKSTRRKPARASTADYWKEETLARKEAMGEFYGLFGPDPKYSNSTGGHTISDEGIKEKNNIHEGYGKPKNAPIEITDREEEVEMDFDDPSLMQRRFQGSQQIPEPNVEHAIELEFGKEVDDKEVADNVSVRDPIAADTEGEHPGYTEITRPVRGPPSDDNQQMDDLFRLGPQNPRNRRRRRKGSKRPRRHTKKIYKADRDRELKRRRGHLERARGLIFGR